MIRAYWACKGLHNMGDVLTKYILQKVTGEEVQFTHDHTKPHLFVSGSILREATGNTFVVGSGFNGKQQSFKGKPRIYSVRGPITLRQLPPGYGDLPVGDPAISLPLLYTPTVNVEYDVGIVPHYVDSNSKVITRYIEDSDYKVNVINILANVEEVVDEINRCSFILSSTLHGLITAHAYGIPGVWVEFSDGVLGGGYKFLDYFESFGTKDTMSPLDCREEIPYDVLNIGDPVLWNNEQAKRFIDSLKEAVEDYKQN